jgi:hypothetical protein
MSAGAPHSSIKLINSRTRFRAFLAQEVFDGHDD